MSWTLHRLHELGVAREVHPKLATGERTLELIRRLDALVDELQLEGQVKTWRLRLAALTRNMDHEELFFWLEKLKLRHADRRVLRQDNLMPSRLQGQLATTDATDWDVYQSLHDLSLEAVLFTLARTTGGPAADHLRRYLTELRHRSGTGGDRRRHHRPGGPRRPPGGTDPGRAPASACGGMPR